MHLLKTVGAGLSLLGFVSLSQAHAASYDESVSGDLSNIGATPTSIAVGLGSNMITGTTGKPGAVVDRDYFTIDVPVGLVFSKLLLLPGTSVSGGASFLGLEAGAKVTLPPDAGDATGLLGWIHYSNGDVGTDLFPSMSLPSFGSSGFAAPLGAGKYSFWVQDFGGGTPGYVLDIQLSAAPVPEPGAVVGMLAGLGLAAGVAMRRKAGRG